MKNSQWIIDALLRLGFTETQAIGRFRAFKHALMRADECVLIGKRATLRIGNTAQHASISLVPERFMALLERRLAGIVACC